LPQPVGSAANQQGMIKIANLLKLKLKYPSFTDPDPEEDISPP
jgi:hypothetical protein